MKTLMKIGVEKIVLLLLSVTFFIGTWHAFPLLDIVSDEMYFVGGVLRAMENYQLIPIEGDVPYGTITYIINYISTIIVLIVLFPIFSFKISAIKFYLIQSPSIMYLFTRINSAIIAILYLQLIWNFLKREQRDIKVRLFLLTLVFTNVLTTTVLHTGKQHVLSIFLVLVSFYFLYRAVADESSVGEEFRNKNAMYSILFSFLALSNLPLNGYSLINIPILIFYFWKDKIFIYKKIPKYVIIGVIVSGLIISLNSGSIQKQIISVFTEYNPILVEDASIPNMDFWTSLVTYTQKVIYLFPLLLISILLSIKNGIKNKKLFTLGLIYFFVYFSILVTVAVWPVEFASFWRYLVPLNFFLFFILSSFNLSFNRIFYPIIAIALVYFVFTLYYLSVPTTYNQASRWVKENISQNEVAIINNVHDFRLTKNKKASLLSQELFCGTKCKAIIEHDLNSEFKAVVLDDQSLTSATTGMKNFKGVYFLEEKELTDPKFFLEAKFTNDAKDYHSVDYNVGNYFDLDYLKLKNFGKNVYIYRHI